MNSKSTFLLLLTAICSFSASGQTIPYKFNSIRTLYSNELLNNKISEINFRERFKRKPADSLYLEFATLYTERVNSLITIVDSSYEQKIDSLKAEIKAAKTSTELKRLRNEISELIADNGKEIKEIKQMRNTVKEFNYLARSARNFNIFHVWSAPDAQAHYNISSSDKNSKFLQNTLISYAPTGGTVSIFNELFADYFGPVRVGFGALLANSSEEDETTNGPTDKTETIQNDAVQRLLGGGGNAVVNLSYPLMDYNNNAELLFLKLAFAPKFAADIPSIGTESGDFSIHRNIGVEGSIFYNGFLETLTVFSNFRFARLDGNRNFYEYLDKEDRSTFWFNQVSLGLAINSTFRVSGNYYFGGSFSNATIPFSLSFSIVPNN